MWLIASAGLFVALIPCAVVVLRGDPVNRLVGLEMTAIVESLQLICLAQGMQRTPFYDVALALAFLAFGGGLVFARFLERWL